jgi:hypothetical protein
MVNLFNGLLSQVGTYDPQRDHARGTDRVVNHPVHMRPLA